MSTLPRTWSPGDVAPISVALGNSAGQNLRIVKFQGICQQIAAGWTNCAWANFTGAAAGVPVSSILSEPLIDGALARISYQIPPTAPLGAALPLVLVNGSGITTSGAAVPLASSLSVPVGVSAGCISTIQALIKNVLAVPSKLGLQAIETKFKTALSTGTCQ